MNKQIRAAFFDCLARHIPNPTTELNYSSPFELLIAVILSAQATDKSVNLATKKLFAIANTPQAMRQLGVEGIKPYIRTIGLFNSKAENIYKTCCNLIEKHRGAIPDNRAQLEALPGVGRKTANVVLNTAFGLPLIAVDTHIFRVSNRTKIATGKTPLEVENKLSKYVPKQHLHDAHHLLILHGRYTCVARKPKCHQCVVHSYCEYKHKTA